MSQPGATRADRLRAIALERIAEHLGYQRDRNDRTRWKRPGSVISINGTKYFDHVAGRGGGGAIDLVIHASGCPFRAALDLLEQIAPEDDGTMAGPKPEHWQQVQRYLTRQRGLDPELIDHCRRRCLVDVDRRANAIFVTRNADGTPTGAELHGTRPGRPFKGMTHGSRKAQGGFWIARRKSGPALLAESAIDALSALSITELGHVAIVISTAGVATRLPPWIRHLDPETILCGYDADETGDTAAQRLIENHPAIRRMRPVEGTKDWNGQLQAARHRLAG